MIIPVAEVKLMNVILNVFHQRAPVMTSSVQLPAESSSITLGFAEQGSLVTKLLWNTAHVHTGTAQAPLRAKGGRLDVIKTGNLLWMKVDESKIGPRGKEKAPPSNQLMPPLWSMQGRLNHHR